MNCRLNSIASSLEGLCVVSLIIFLGIPRLAINFFSVYFNSSVNIDLDNFKCTAFVVAQVNITMYPFIS